jgi:predicted esterase
MILPGAILCWFFLHGSGEDDRGILTYTRLTEGDYIEVAPNGRNVSNCFATPEALDDIRRAIDDVILNYSVDTSRIVIGGFSMGGYGALRAFYADPMRYKGVAVISGHPDLASRWLGGQHPDFTEPGYLSCFRDVPVFVYHSETDRNCPWEVAQVMASGLKTAEAGITLVTSPAGGHALMDEASRLSFYEWLRSLAGN